MNGLIKNYITDQKFKMLRPIKVVQLHQSRVIV